MDTKTITITTEAYDRLQAAKRPDESFSDAIKRFAPKPRVPITQAKVEAWLDSIASDPVNGEFVPAVEEQIARRPRRPR